MNTSIQKRQDELEEAEERLRISEERRQLAEIERLTISASSQFESSWGEQIEALVSTIKAGNQLKTLVKNSQNFQDYPTFLPILYLQKIINNIHQQNQFIAHQGSIRDLIFSPNVQNIATVGEDGTARLWDLSGKQLVEFKGENNAFESVEFSPDGKFLVTIEEEGIAKLLDSSGKEIANLKGHNGNILSAIFISDGQQILTYGEDKKLIFWNLSGKKISQRIHNEPGDLFFSRDVQKIAIQSSSQISVWKLSGELLSHFVKQGEGNIISVSPDLQHVAVALETERGLQIWNLSGKQLAQCSDISTGQTHLNIDKVVVKVCIK